MEDDQRKSILNERENPFYSDYILKNQNSFILEDSGRYSLNLPFVLMNISPFLNKDGVVKIGDSLFCYSKDFVKIIPDGDDNKLNGIKEITDNSPKQGVLVFKNYEKKLSSLSNAFFTNLYNGNQLTCNSNDGDAGSIKHNEDKVNGFVALFYMPNTQNPNYVDGYLGIRSESWRKNGIFGGYTKKLTSELVIDSEITVSQNGSQTFNDYLLPYTFLNE